MLKVGLGKLSHHMGFPNLSSLIREFVIIAVYTIGIIAMYMESGNTKKWNIDRWNPPFSGSHLQFPPIAVPCPMESGNTKKWNIDRWNLPFSGSHLQFPPIAVPRSQPL